MHSTDTPITQEQHEALAAARELVYAGVPVFRATPCPPGCPLPAHAQPGWHYPARWQRTPAYDLTAVEEWREGDALAAVCGVALDVIDVDPRNGGEATAAGLREAGLLPHVYAAATTPRGGTHWFVARLGVAKGKIEPGVDIQAGAPDGDGRGFVFIAPTVREYPGTGLVGTYRWVRAPRADVIRDSVADDDSGAPLAELVRKPRERMTAPAQRSGRIVTKARRYTMAAAEAYVMPAVEAFASQGYDGHNYNVQLNNLAMQVGHFVKPRPDAPGFITRGEAEAMLYEAAVRCGCVTAPPGYIYQPMGERGVRETIKSGLDAGMAQPYVHDEGGPGKDDDDPGTPLYDATRAAIEAEADRMRIRLAARDIVDIEAHDRTWREPASYGSLADELAIPRTTVQWRVKSLLSTGGNAVVVAARKAGKTTLTANLVRALVDGEPFLGRFDVDVPDGGVALFNYEVAPEQYRDWLRDVGIGHPDRVFPLHLRGKTLSLANPRVRDWVVAWLAEREIRTWIIDPYLRAATGVVDNENDNGQANVFLDYLDRIKTEAGVNELIIPAHTRKGREEFGSESARGAGRLEDWADVLWYVTKDPETGQRFMRAEGRDVDHPEELLTYDSVSRGLTLGGWDRRTLAHRREVDELVVFVTDHPGCSQNDIRTNLGKGSESVRKLIVRSGGRVRTVPGPGNTTLHYANGS